MIVGQNVAKEILAFFQREYGQKNTDHERKIVFHLCTGTDTNLMAKIIHDVE